MENIYDIDNSVHEDINLLNKFLKNLNNDWYYYKCYFIFSNIYFMNLIRLCPQKKYKFKRQFCFVTKRKFL